MEKLVILVVSDEEYLYMVEPLFNSIVKNVTIPYRFHLHTVNVTDQHRQYFMSNYTNITISNDNILLDGAPCVSNPFSKSNKSAYCANIRAKVLYDVLNSGNDPVLYLDVDSIVRGDMVELYTFIKESDLMIFKRQLSKKINTKFLTGVIGVNNTKVAFDLIGVWWSEIQKGNNLFRWYSDQIYFYEATERYKNATINTLPKKYIDWDFSDSGIIWVGKAERKYEDERYLKEVSFYKNIGRVV